MNIRSVVLMFATVAAIAAPTLAQMRRPAAGAATPRQQVGGQTYQLLQFRFGTGDDDLRSDSDLTARITFPDKSTQNCALHGSKAVGGEANIGWDNHTTHESAPCRLDRAWTLNELKRSKIELDLFGYGGGMVIDSGDDNWNINSIAVQAYNPGNPQRANLFCYRGDPLLVRLTGSMPKITITDLPTQC